jgi:hypothetical protein
MHERDERHGDFYLFRKISEELAGCVTSRVAASLFGDANFVVFMIEI